MVARRAKIQLRNGSRIANSVEMETDSPFASFTVGADSIRTVRVLPDLDDGGLIQCQWRLSIPGTSYLPISYEWGKGIPTRPIKIYQQTLYVKDNLYSFLEFARLNRAGQWLWIDALCINQDDHQEKSRQIAIMQRIYSRPRRILAFIPDIGHHSSHNMAPSGLSRMAWKFMQKISNGRWSTVSAPYAFDSRLVDSSSWKRILAGTLQIARSTYWTRLWIVQEIVLARDVDITNGRHVASWDSFQKLLRIVEDRSYISASAADRTTSSVPSRLQELRAGRWPASLTDLILDFASLECQNFQDRTYALASLAYNGHCLHVDYSVDPIRHFLQTIEFCRGSGAYLHHHSQLFSVSHKLRRAMDIELDSIEDWCFGQDVLTCNTTISSARTVQPNFHAQPFSECEHCHTKMKYIGGGQPYILLCLYDEGVESHLVMAVPQSRPIRGQWTEVSISLPYAITDGGLSVTQAVSIALESAPNKPHERLRLSAASFLEILQRERAHTGDCVPRTQKLCMINASEPDLHVLGERLWSQPANKIRSACQYAIVHSL
ncbi:uncharacterized protein HMPREF1541_04375 [Cyphellophora europaea CBS 101466]|uniref:Heterokaryon incompatibility domain-containing protein n=1 Tax=Cyphellophora europaea (strain CBS 101466) TaxID=1220924 RepID=W2RUW9_CYPE1|nr:uncharacterized protein HMPREF1541_04375 [Cyphellophora europaea CBS 101466]ETN40100.1 hypothetical protein HMPREF1541_04375 [Cyphellophora europaea CBS 101466]